MTSRTAFLACGALARETRQIVDARGWAADVHGVSSDLHMTPLEIAPAVDAKLAALTRRYDRVIVVYGDCGTGGRLDEVIARYPAARPAGVHCFQWFAQGAPARLRDDPGIYFLTDWLVRNWDRAVVRGLALDRFPWMRDAYFAHITRVLYLRQDPDDQSLVSRAYGIAGWMQRPIEVNDTGMRPLEELLAPLMEDADVRA